MGSGIFQTSLNALLVGSISVDVVVWMKLVLLNGEYRISEESHNMMWDNYKIVHYALPRGSTRRVTERTG